MKQKKAPGPNGITNEVVKLIFKAILKTITLLYNECLRKFPSQMENSKSDPNNQTRKRRERGSVEVPSN